MINDNGTPGTTADDYVRYTPAADYFGPDSFTYKVCDNGQSGSPLADDFKCATAVATITVTPVNDAPTINAISNQAMLSSVPLTVGMTGISEGPLNERDDQTLGVTASSSDTSVAEVSVAYAPDASTGTLTITPKPTSCGATTITVTVTDSGPATPPNDNSTNVSFTVSTFHGHFLAPLKEGAHNLVQKGQVVPVKIDFGCPGSMPGLTPAIKLVKGDYTSDPEDWHDADRADLVSVGSRYDGVHARGGWQVHVQHVCAQDRRYDGRHGTDDSGLAAGNHRRIRRSDR